MHSKHLNFIVFLLLELPYSVVNGCLASGSLSMLWVSWHQIIVIEPWLEAALLHLLVVHFPLDLLPILLSFFHLCYQPILDGLSG